MFRRILIIHKNNGSVTDVDKIIEKAYSGREIIKEECIEMLSLDDASAEAFDIRAAATNIIRKRNGNAGYIFAQIGITCMPCDGNCKFCSFGKDHTTFGKIELSDKDIVKKVKELSYDGNLYGLYLMTIHNYDIEHFLHCVKLVKSSLNALHKFIPMLEIRLTRTSSE